MHKTALLLSVVAASAAAHDTWFEPGHDPGGAPTLALGTGAHFPAQETALTRPALVELGCRAGRVSTTPRLARETPEALHLRPAPGMSRCWAQSVVFDITLPPDTVSLYLQELRAGPAVRERWADLQRRGLPWRERYTKHARIELGAPSAEALPLGLDLAIDTPGPLRAGTSFAVQVRRDGQPLPGLAVELRSEHSPLGVWRLSDAQGRLTMPAPLPGRWLLRAIELRPAAGDAWDSRFVTLAFDIGPAADQNGSSSSSNSLSASQTAASAAMASDPPLSTATR
ncbi:MAG: DUF4198 domain-containing protein [Rubrivivax sp.]|nr:DUF4198 domain-containing protein [Rubrivivax sp.]